MATPALTDLLARNKAATASYQPMPYLSEMTTLNLSPITTVIVTCVDPRVSPDQFFGLKLGDAIVIRNTGGRVESALKEIAVLDSLLGHDTLKQLLIVHHTDCGASHFKDAAVKAEIAARHPEKKAEIETWYTGSFGGRSTEESVKEDLAIAQADELLGESIKKGTHGFVLDIKTGLLTEV
ncbi:carbonic anhydrase [Dichomitus squalens]|uniref:Carbonic anhydrase n=1 Tax=Dichomitus squalens TaxID=114155 RepID=A0A4Q9PIV0_9APHY|nr:carbonic anhydrase [Dichomitus squalens]TBU53993.1 carbonic anhydrase [Dichomitus squalens]